MIRNFCSVPLGAFVHAEYPPAEAPGKTVPVKTIPVPNPPQYSPLWEWMERREEEGGYIDTLRLKWEFDTFHNSKYETIEAVKRELAKTFPATEPPIEDLLLFFHEANEKGNRWAIGPYLTDLGYKMENTGSRIVIELPSPQLLLARWDALVARLKVARPDLKLPPLRIFIAEMLDDEAFLQAYFKHDIVLGTSLHDHVIHALKTISYILFPPKIGLDYEANKKRDVEVVQAIYNRIINARKLTADAVQRGETHFFFTYYGSHRVPLEEFPKYLTKLTAALSLVADGLAARGKAVEMDPELTQLTEKAVRSNIWDLESPLYFLAKDSPEQVKQKDFKDEEYFERRFPKSECPHTCERIFYAMDALEEEMKN